MEVPISSKSAVSLSYRQVENLVVVVQACLAMQLESTTKHALLIIDDTVAHAPQTCMGCSHSTHCAWLLHHIAVKSCA